MEWLGTAEFKTRAFQSTGFGSPADWIIADLNDPVDYIGVPVDWTRQKVLGVWFQSTGPFVATWIKMQSPGSLMQSTASIFFQLLTNFVCNIYIFFDKILSNIIKICIIYNKINFIINIINFIKIYIFYFYNNKYTFINIDTK